LYAQEYAMILKPCAIFW